MKIKKTFEDLIEDSAGVLNDPRHIRYSEKFIRDALNEGQYVAVDKSGELRARTAIVAKENQTIFNYPEDLIRPLRLEDKNGNELTPNTSKRLQQIFGTGFRSRDATGTPKYYFSDLVGDMQFELYPVPTEVFEKAPVEFTVGTLASRLNLIEDVLAYDIWGNLLYILTTNFVFVFRIIEDDLILERSINHGEGLTVLPDQTAAIRVVKHGYNIPSSTSKIIPGVIYFANGTALNRIDLADVDTFNLVATAATTINHILEFEYYQPEFIYLQIATSFNIIKYSVGGTPVTVSSAETDIIFQSTGNFETRDLYFVVRGVGVRKLVTSTDTVSSISTDSSTGVAATQDANNTIYFNNYTTGFINSLDPSTDTITATTLTISGTAGSFSKPLVSNQLDRFWYIDEHTTDFSETESFFQEVVLGVKTRTVFPTFLASELFAHEMAGAAYKDVLFIKMFTSGLVQISSFEHGVISNIDDITFNQEEGILKDIVDDTDIVNIDSELGTVGQITVNSEVAYVNYVRCPALDVLEIKQHWALIYYVQFKAKRQDGDDRSLLDANKFEQDFLDIVADEAVKTGDGHVPENQGTTPVFY